jgi:ribosomal protein L12E/L44/L45/RPP1/RPP2
MRDEYIRKAVSNASTIKAIVLGEDLQVPTKKEKGKKKKDKKEKAEEDEEEEVGIGGLFGN